MGDAPNEYDFIICGGGTSGCVVAGRLAESPNTTVLVIEAGKHNRNLEAVHMPGGWPQLPGSEQDWNIVSEGSAAINGRKVNLTRGKFLGGSSGANGTLCVRGTKQDYDDWDLPGWSGDEFFNYMSKAETFHPKPWFRDSKGSHGSQGPLHTEPQELAPISKLIMDSMISKGLPQDDDMFAHGGNPHGCGHAVRTTFGGQKKTSADFVTNSQRQNLHVMTGTYVDKVIFAGDGPRAVGVLAVKEDGTTLELKARKEIIISAGAYCSPNILNRSGIGEKEELERHGIPVVSDLPGVGKNLMDHPIAYIFYETNKPGLTKDAFLFHGNAFEESYKLYKETKTGVLSSFPFGAFAYARLDSRLKDSILWNSCDRKPGRDPMGLTPSQPNIEFFTTECYGGPKQFDRFPIEGQHTFGIIAELFNAQSRGTVALRNTNPLEKPVVNCNYLENPLDLEILAEACAFANEIITEGAGTKNIVKGSWPPEEIHHLLKTRDEWKEYAKANVTTCYHAAGTCAMGTASDPWSVVDETLRVKGVVGLRVADCSIMPILNNGHTQMPAYGIGEKAADLIKEAHLSDMTRSHL